MVSSASIQEPLRSFFHRPTEPVQAELKAAGILPAAVELRQVKDLNNLIEQDHRFIKRRVKLGLGFFSFETAWRTLQGYEVMLSFNRWFCRFILP